MSSQGEHIYSTCLPTSDWISLDFTNYIVVVFMAIHTVNQENFGVENFRLLKFRCNIFCR